MDASDGHQDVEDRAGAMDAPEPPLERALTPLGRSASALGRPTTAAPPEHAGPAVAAVSALGAPLIFALMVALSAWGGFGVATHLLDPDHWRIDAAATERATARALRRLAAPARAPTTARYAAWSREIVAALADDDAGPDLPLAESWMVTGPLVMGESAFVARGALALGAPPPFPGDVSHGDAAAATLALAQAAAAQEKAAEGRFAHRALAHLAEPVRARYAAAGGEARARGFLPGADTGQVDAVRLRAAPSRRARPTFGGLSRELVLYGDIGVLTVQLCASLRQEDAAAAPALCGHPDLPTPPEDRGALALAAVSAALSGAAGADEEALKRRQTGVAVVHGALRRGVAEPVERALRAQAQMAVRTTVLEAEAQPLLSEAAALTGDGAFAEALAGVAQRSLITADAEPLRPVLEAAGAAATAASRETALRLVTTAESVRAFREAAAVAAAAGPPALALEHRRGDLAGLARWRLAMDLSFARDIAVLGLSLVFALLALGPAIGALRRPQPDDSIPPAADPGAEPATRR